MKKRELTCIGCPLGCALTVCEEGEQITVTGNTCKRGSDYAIKEISHPTRIVTSAIPVRNGDVAMVSVKTREDVPKEKIFDCMAEIHRTVVCAPVKIGDVLLKDCAGTGVSVVATKNVNRN
ncbi:MAG: DUF1667 domain-containing protein [Hungatella sp.]